MSCCCANAAQAIIAAGAVTLFAFLPCAFYGLVDISFHFAEQKYQSLAIFSTITCVGAALFCVIGLTGGRCSKNDRVLSSVFWLCLCWSSFAVAMVLWAGAVAAEGHSTTEGKILAAGSVILLGTGLLLTPFLWFTYELFAYRRQLRGGDSDVEEKAFIRRRKKMREPATIDAEIGRPVGRVRRGRQGRQQHVSAVQSASSGGSSSSEAEFVRGKERHGSSRRTRI